MMIIPDELWIGEPKCEDLIDNYMEKDTFLEGEEDELMANLLEGLKDEPLILEYLGIF